MQTQQTNTFVTTFILIQTLIKRYVSIYIPAIEVRLKENISQKQYFFNLGWSTRQHIVALAHSIDTKFNKAIELIITYDIVCLPFVVKGMKIV